MTTDEYKQLYKIMCEELNFLNMRKIIGQTEKGLLVMNYSLKKDELSFLIEP